MFNCIIVDDETKARILLRNMLAETDNTIQVLAECEDLASCVRAIRQHKPHVVFLDIEMPGTSGIEILSFFEESEVDFRIVFTTGYSEYALQAFRLSAIDYLLKPINPLELASTVERIQKDISSTPGAYRALYENLSVSRDAGEKCMLINLSNATRFVKLRDIIMLRAEGSYTEFYLKGGEKLLASKNLKLFEERLAGSSQFFRSHKSFIINLRYVRECNRSEGIIQLDGNYEAFLSGDKYDSLVSKMEQLV